MGSSLFDGEQVGAAGFRRTKGLNNASQCLVGPRACIQWFGGQSDIVDADHLSRSGNKATH